MIKKSNRDGGTLVEVLVVLGITSVLMGLLAPAIQASREAARASDCRHRMQQVVMAAHGFESTHGRLPVTFFTRVGRPAFPRMLSAWAQLLPFLDNAPLYQQIDLDPEEIGLGVYNNPPSLTRSANQRLLKTSLPIVMCPSDSTPAGSCNFRACLGAGPAKYSKLDSGAWAPNGFQRDPNLALITDGLSQTAFIRERIVGDFDSNRFTPARDIYSFNGQPPSDPDGYARACRSQFTSPLPGEISYSGSTWLVNGLPFTHYNHTLPPNSDVPDCTAEEKMVYNAAVSARSWHPNGVHVAFADGHVVRISEAIDLGVWRAIATRQRGETVQSPN